MRRVTWGVWACAAGVLAVEGPTVGRAQQCVVLLAEKILEVGRVCAEERGDSLVVTYRTDGGWMLAETHLTLASSRDSFPLAGGRQPILGQFIRVGAHQPPVAELAYSFAAGEVQTDSGGRVLIAAHATVVREVEERGAWATGTLFTATGSPAAYFVHQRPGRSPPR